jgi:hypothetical protein
VIHGILLYVLPVSATAQLVEEFWNQMSQKVMADVDNEQRKTVLVSIQHRSNDLLTSYPMGTLHIYQKARQVAPFCVAAVEDHQGHTWW